MASVAAGLSSRQVAVDVREARARNVRVAVAVFAPAIGLCQVVTDVDDDERLIAKSSGEIGGGNQRTGHGLQSFVICGGGSARRAGCNCTAMIPATMISATPSHATSGSA